VILAARQRPKAKLTSPFESPIPILCRLSVEIFRMSVTVQRLFVCICLGGNLADRFRNFASLGVLTRNVIAFQRDP
jgi:hypothetical protein